MYKWAKGKHCILLGWECKLSFGGVSKVSDFYFYFFVLGQSFKNNNFKLNFGMHLNIKLIEIIVVRFNNMNHYMCNHRLIFHFLKQ